MQWQRIYALKPSLVSVYEVKCNQNFTSCEEPSPAMDIAQPHYVLRDTVSHALKACLAVAAAISEREILLATRRRISGALRRMTSLRCKRAAQLSGRTIAAAAVGSMRSVRAYGALWLFRTPMPGGRGNATALAESVVVWRRSWSSFLCFSDNVRMVKAAWNADFSRTQTPAETINCCDSRATPCYWCKRCFCLKPAVTVTHHDLTKLEVERRA